MGVTGTDRRSAAWLGLAGAVVVLAGGPAVAAPRAGRVAILTPDLAVAAERAAIAELRSRGFIVVPEVELYRTIERLGVRETTAAGRLALVRALDLAATMTIQPPKREPQLTTRGLLRDRRDRLIRVWRWSQDVDPAPPPPPGPTPSTTAPPAPAPTTPPAPRRTATPAVARSVPAATAPAPAPRAPVFALAAGPRLLYRRLAYDGGRPGQLTDFETQVPALGLGVRADWFPLGGRWRGLGLVAQLEQGLPVRSQTPVGSFLSPARDVAAAGRWRVSRLLALDLGVGLHRFDFRAQEVDRRLPRPLPDVAYRYLQAGLELQARTAGRLAMMAAAHYRHVVHGGGVTSRDWFPGARIRGLDASAGIELHLTEQVSAAVGMDMRRYQLDFGPSSSTRGPAGASDSYYAGWARLGFQLGASGT